MTMTKLPMGCRGGMVGVAVPLTSTTTAQDATKENALAGGAKATVVLTPAVDASSYTPAATLVSGVDDAEGVHHTSSAESQLDSTDVAAMSAQENWSAGRMNPFARLFGPLVSVCDWLADLVSAQSMESGLVLAGAQPCDLSVPVVSMMALTEEASGQPNVVSSQPDKGTSSRQTDGNKKAPPQTKQYEEVPRWKIVLAMTAGRR